jgi:hypothetical protein
MVFSLPEERRKTASRKPSSGFEYGLGTNVSPSQEELAMWIMLYLPE